MYMPNWMPVILYATIIMVFLGVYAWNHMDDGIGRRPFVMLIFLTAFMLVTDLISRCFIYEGFPHLLVVGSTLATFLMLPAIGAEWYQYVRSVLSAEERLSTHYLDLTVNVAASAGTVVLMSSPVTRWVFYFNEAGEYLRGNLFVIPALTMFLIMIIAEVFLLLRARSHGRQSVSTLLFPLPPMVGAALSLVFPDVPWIPLGVSVSMVVLFSDILTTGMGTDYLTGAYNRKRLEEILTDHVERAQNGHQFAAIMLDIDNFKRINDTLGHAVGDVVLAETAQLLKRCVRAGDMVARFGGDEFFVLLDIDRPELLKTVIERIESEEGEFSAGGYTYMLRLSKGCDFFNPEKFTTAKEFEEHLDGLMYENKQLHRLANQLVGTTASDDSDVSDVA